MSSLDDIKQTFFLECEELLEALNDGLADIEAAIPDDTFDTETINAVFRTVHSIKGGAASFGLEPIVRFSHCFETVLDLMRSGKVRPDTTNVRVLHRAADHLADLVAASRSDTPLDAAAGDALLAQLNALAGHAPQVAAPVVPIPDVTSAGPDDGDLAFLPLAIPFDFDPAGAGEPIPRTFRIEMTCSRELFANGHDPVHLFRELAALGDLTVEADLSALPDFDALDPLVCLLSWRLELLSEASEEDLREIFEFVEGLAQVRIEASSGAQDATGSQDAVEAPHELPPPPVATFDADPAARPPAPETSEADAPSTRREAKAAPGRAPKSTVRVDLDLVDSLINIVGELVINQSVLSQSLSDANVAHRSEIGGSLDEYKNLALQIQECVMSLRAQSVKQLFQRMARIVRETSEIAGKSVAFETDGEDTEIDKTVIERLIEPLTHILRNAIDHGLEAPDRRRAAGKTPTGTVRLSAGHRSGRVVIEVSDDGSGINRPKVQAIAVKKGLIAPDLQLSDNEIDRLLFLPGFSTADSVTDLSGRGVGMDVVRSEIQKLGGRVGIFSHPGKGTTFSISLPLTLAVLDGMVVDVAGQTMVVPITSVVETIRPDLSDLHMIGATSQVIKVRDALVPIVDLGMIFSYRDEPVDRARMVILLVETEQSERWGLAVDRIIDQRQVVIKSLEGNYGHVDGVAAATILGDGKIALIIDPEETARMADSGSAVASLMSAAGG
ncbi:chemotaxis protein CheA [Roseivivax isoporae]|uniref:Chemotaxis protein CheA n=1 Tax=Roseivivax isoporae LMG 25204 TaxID=1449351 RepID=X7FEW7_9RHOB|nr:chemotaxis protein CheA [Roseivivax isoporae]ETX30611.1 chemotaxis protein CheA [Roseivivax isoporae LMG 25204]